MATLNHIGIAVSNLPKMKELFALLDLPVTHTEPVPEQGVVTHFLPLVELLEPTDPQGAVAKYIQKRGPGVHHLSFSVARGELEPTCQRLKAAGYQLVYEQPKLGAHSMRINFIHPASCGGVLIELMEPCQ